MSKRASRTRHALVGYAFLSPALIGVLLFMVVPIGVIMWVSLYRWDLIGDTRYVGLANVTNVLSDPAFLSSLRTTILFVLLVVPIQIILGLLLANLMMAKMGLNNTFWGIVLPFVFASPYAVFLLRQSFRQIPQEIIDAATMDGAGQIRILFSIVVPVSKPIISTLVLITVVSQWNSFMWPRIIAATRPRVLTVATAALQSQYNANWTYVMAATTIALVPLIALFIVFQRHIVESIALTGIK